MPTLLQFPNAGLQILSACIHILGVAVLTHCLSRRLIAEDLTSWQSIKQITWPHLCILLIFLDSWLFLFSSGILIFGLGLESSPVICASAIYLCVAFYATSKVLIYFFLIEKVHLVWSPHGSKSPRLQSKIYLLCFVTVLLYSVIIVLMIVGRNAYFREGDASCVIGLKQYASISLLAYDLYINILLTGLFLYPLLRTKLRNPRVTRVATRTLVASGAALTTSTINMAVLTLLRGHELGWLCLGAGCGADVIFNAFALFWVTSTSSHHTTGNSSGVIKEMPERPRAVDRAAARRMTVLLSPPGSAAPSPTRSMFDVPRSPTKSGFDPSALQSPTKTVFSPPSPTAKSFRDNSPKGYFEFPVNQTGISSVERDLERDPTKGSESDHSPKKSVWSKVFGKRTSVDQAEGLQITVTTERERVSEDTTTTSSKKVDDLPKQEQNKP